MSHGLTTRQAFSQTLRTGRPEGRHVFPQIYNRLTKFSLYFFQKWASTEWLDTFLAKTLPPDGFVSFLIIAIIKYSPSISYSGVRREAAGTGGGSIWDSWYVL